MDVRTRYPGRTFDDLEPEPGRDWNTRRGTSNLEWCRARLATRDDGQRMSVTVERAAPGDSDRDGKQGRHGVRPTGLHVLSALNGRPDDVAPRVPDGRAPL